MLALIASAALLVVDIPPASSDDTQQAYQAAKAAAGRSPDDQVRLAYWCEAHGLGAERMRHLAQAVLADPNHFAARGLLGLVSRGGHWMRPEAVAEQVKADPALAATLAEYDAKRSSTPYTADGQWGLALWAEDRGLKDQAKAHLTAVVRLDPKREVAWKRLGYKKHDGRWATDAELAATKADAEAQKLADRKWKTLLEKWKAQLSRPSRKAEAEANFLTVTDPRAVRQVQLAFLTGSTPSYAVALRILSQIDSAAASRLITMIAVLSDDPNVRRAAVETLRLRDPREFADMLITALRDRVEYEVQQVEGPGSVGKLLIKEPKKRVQRLYSTPAVPNYLTWLTQVSDGAPTLTYHYQGQEVIRGEPVFRKNMNFQDFMHFRPTDTQLSAAVRHEQQNAPATIQHLLQTSPQIRGLQHLNPGTFDRRLQVGILETRETRIPLQTDSTIPLAAMIAEYQKTALVAQQQIAQDVAQIDQYNRQVADSNDRLTQILRTVSGEDYGAEIPRWTSWLVNLSGYAMTSNPSQADVPTYSVDVPLAYQPRAVPNSQTTFVTGPITTATQATVRIGAKGMDCFGAGTLVQTMTGPHAIETLQIGDLVLTQSTSTGALRYQPILLVHHNPPSPTFHIKVAGEVIASSPFHRFWKVGQGWVMARDIHEGDRLRLLSGTAEVEQSDPGKSELVYNLDIAEDADFFAGTSAVLVHDNTLLDPRLVPFDLPQTDSKAVAVR